METSKLETILYNTILAWYDDSLYNYDGIDDEEFVERVCEKTGMSKEEFEYLMNGDKHRISLRCKNGTPEEKESLRKEFESTIDVYLKAKGLQ